jgi:hypothetical protein
MKPASKQSQATRDKKHFAFARGASVIALCVAALVAHANATILANPVALNLHSNHINHKLESGKNLSSVRLSSILSDLQHPSALLEQAALSWPPQFAIGQTWTINMVGIGNWTLPLSETVAGDATGYTTGTDKREGWFQYFPKSGTSTDYVLNFLQGDNETLVCFIDPPGNPSGNTLSGSAFRIKTGIKDPEDLKTTCSATLAANSSTTTSPFATPNVPLNPNANTAQSSTPVWPPKPGESWTVTIDGLAPWAINFEKLDKDGDPIGSALQGGAKFVAAAFKDNDGYEFGLTNDTTVFFCTFSTLQVQGNAFVGGQSYSGLKSAQSIPSLKKSCTAAIGSSANTSNTNQTSNLSWPPSIALGQNWVFAIQGGGSWTVTLEKPSAIAGAFSGSVKGTDARNNGIIGYDTKGDYTVAAVYGATDTWLCLAAKSGFSNSNLTGETYRSVGNASPVKTNTICTMSLAGAASTNSPTLGGLFGSAATSTATATGLSWPVQVAPGQSWSVNVKNIVFQLKLERVNGGITIGTATSSAGELAGGFVTQGDNLNLILTDGTATITCTFGRASIQGQTLSGQATYTEKPNAPEQSWGACSATLAPKVSSKPEPLNFTPKNVLTLEPQIMGLQRFSSW